MNIYHNCLQLVQAASVIYIWAKWAQMIWKLILQAEKDGGN